MSTLAESPGLVVVGTILILLGGSTLLGAPEVGGGCSGTSTPNAEPPPKLLLHCGGECEEEGRICKKQSGTTGGGKAYKWCDCDANEPACCHLVYYTEDGIFGVLGACHVPGQCDEPPLCKMQGNGSVSFPYQAACMGGSPY